MDQNKPSAPGSQPPAGTPANPPVQPTAPQAPAQPKAAAPAQQAPATPPAEPQAPQQMVYSSSNSHKPLFFIAIAIVILVALGGGAYVFWMKKSAPKPVATTQMAHVVLTPTPALSPTPGVTPVTSANVDQTLNNTDTTVQQSTDQANTDLNQVSNIDSSQDSTNGL